LKGTIEKKKLLLH